MSEHAETATEWFMRNPESAAAEQQLDRITHRHGPIDTCTLDCLEQAIAAPTSPLSAGGREGAGE